MDKAGVPCGPINTIDKVFADPQVQHLGIARPVDHPKYGSQKVVGQPIHLSRYPQPEKLGHTPEAGRAHRGDTGEPRLRQVGDQRAAREARSVRATSRELRAESQRPVAVHLASYSS